MGGLASALRNGGGGVGFRGWGAEWVSLRPATEARKRQENVSPASGVFGVVFGPFWHPFLVTEQENYSAQKGT